MDGEGDQAEESVVEGAQRRIRATCSVALALSPSIHIRAATFASLYLEEPYRDVDGDAEWPARLLELVDSELRESDALAGTDLLVDTATINLPYTYMAKIYRLTRVFPSQRQALRVCRIASVVVLFARSLQGSR